MVFNQEGAPPHFHHNIRGLVDKICLENGLDVVDQHSCPKVTTPDTDFFALGICQGSNLCATNACHIKLKKGIGRAVESVGIEVLQDLWMELQYRLDVCRVTSGAYI
jgi:hypothetical protein